MATVILFNKPFQVLSQFSDRDNPSGPKDMRAPAGSSEGKQTATRETLTDYFSAPEFRVAGRLDYDSEGLLLLTDNGQLQQQIANPRHRLWKTYWVQVEGTAEAAQLDALRNGVTLRDGPTLPARVRRIDAPVGLWPRTPPVRTRLTVSDSWLKISIREGRNRQLRRMTAAVGLPTLRLIRYAIGDWTLEGLAPGEHRKITVNAPAGGRARQAVKRVTASKRPTECGPTECGPTDRGPTPRSRK